MLNSQSKTSNYGLAIVSCEVCYIGILLCYKELTSLYFLWYISLTNISCLVNKLWKYVVLF